MGEAKLRRDKPLISVLIPERGRPEMLFRLIKSLFATAGGDTRFEVLVAVDDDDPAWAVINPKDQEIKDERVRMFVWPRPKTLGEKINMLAAHAKGDILHFLANDYVMKTEGWPSIMRDAVAALPNGIGVPFPKDALHPDHASFPILSRRMYEGAKMFAPPWFPYWYVDTWWDEIGLLLGLRPQIAIEVEAPEGRGQPQGLRDVTFWATFFDRLRRYRVRDARGLAQIAFGKHSERMRQLEDMIPSRTAFCAARSGHLMTPEFAAVWEGQRDLTPTPEYDAVRRYAANMMQNMEKEEGPRQIRVMVAVPSGRTWEATTANSIAAMAAFSARSDIELCLMNLQTSQISLARNNLVKVALEIGSDYIFWIDSDMKLPPDALARLMAHGKDIVGTTYNQKVERSDGTFKTLGRPKRLSVPGAVEPLQEWDLLPGGVMLVSTKVYKALHWPWYAEAYRWAPDLEGLPAFKEMMREYLDTIPTEAVLDSIDGTLFGQWISQHYRIGDIGLNSEDYFFCSKAKQAGFSIWCDLLLTSEIGHIGERVVTCKMPEGTFKLAAD